jgi:hypothetical protein
MTKLLLYIAGLFVAISLSLPVPSAAQDAVSLHDN